MKKCNSLSPPQTLVSSPSDSSGSSANESRNKQVRKVLQLSEVLTISDEQRCIVCVSPTVLVRRSWLCRLCPKTNACRFFSAVRRNIGRLWFGMWGDYVNLALCHWTIGPHRTESISRLLRPAERTWITAPKKLYLIYIYIYLKCPTWNGASEFINATFLPLNIF